jgi:hypothetical protein
MLGGHPMYVISFPTAGATWLYDGSTGIWSSLKTYGITRHVGEFGINFLQNNLVFDYSVGIIYTLSADAVTDNLLPIESQIISDNVVAPDLQRFDVSKFRVDMEVGDATIAVQNPQVTLQVSRDNGRTYGAEMFHPPGPVGNYINTVEWDRIGSSRNFVFKLRLTDPVPFVLINAIINPDD